MARPIKKKTVKIHYECACGYNCHDQFDTDKFTVRKLLELGYKIRKFKNPEDAGQRFYFCYNKEEDCPGDHYEEYFED